MNYFPNSSQFDIVYKGAKSLQAWVAKYSSGYFSCAKQVWCTWQRFIHSNGLPSSGGGQSNTEHLLTSSKSLSWQKRQNHNWQWLCSQAQTHSVQSQGQNTWPKYQRQPCNSSSIPTNKRREIQRYLHPSVDISLLSPPANHWQHAEKSSFDESWWVKYTLDIVVMD